MQVENLHGGEFAATLWGCWENWVFCFRALNPDPRWFDLPVGRSQKQQILFEAALLDLQKMKKNGVSGPTLCCRQFRNSLNLAMWYLTPQEKRWPATQWSQKVHPNCGCSSRACYPVETCDLLRDAFNRTLEASMITWFCDCGQSVVQLSSRGFARKILKPRFSKATGTFDQHRAIW